MNSLSCAIVQTDIFWENKAKNLAMLEEKIMALQESVELIILPEMFSTGFSMNTELMAEDMSGDSVNWMKRLSRTKKAIITGSVMIKENDCFFNRLIWMLPNGQFGYYDKRHLFGYANEDKYYSKGHKRLITSVNGWKVNLQICYDLRFPVWSRQQFENDSDITHEYDLLIYVANWPSSRANAWKTL
jgi:predicted amidohydrolase